MNAFTTYKELKFVEGVRHGISIRLTEGYLNHPYSWFLNRNSSILGTNILSEADQVVGLGMRPMIEVISRGIVILFLFALLFSIEMMLAFTIIVILGGAYLLIFKSS